MTEFILALTISFTVHHRGMDSAVTTTINETVQQPLQSEEVCDRYALLRELELRRSLIPFGIDEITFNHKCLPTGEEES